MEKKSYIQPELTISVIQLRNMLLTLSDVTLQEGKAQKDSEVLSREQAQWDIWGEYEDDDEY